MNSDSLLTQSDSFTRIQFLYIPKFIFIQPQNKIAKIIILLLGISIHAISILLIFFVSFIFSQHGHRSWPRVRMAAPCLGGAAEHHPLTIDHQHTPSRDSLAFSKGLLNGPGQNNCFLNSAVQVSAISLLYQNCTYASWGDNPAAGKVSLIRERGKNHWVSVLTTWAKKIVFLVI